MSEEIALAPDDQPLEGELATRLEIARDYARRTAFRARFNVIYAGLAIVAALSFFAVYRLTANPVRVVHSYSDRQVNSMLALRAALGKPVAVLDGASLGLPAGTACYGYQKADGVYLLCPK